MLTHKYIHAYVRTYEVHVYFEKYAKLYVY